jgi:hypothetical protein
VVKGISPDKKPGLIRRSLPVERRFFEYFFEIKGLSHDKRARP